MLDLSLAKAVHGVLKTPLDSVFSLILAKKSKRAVPDEEKGFATAILFIIVIVVIAALVMLLFGAYKFPL